MKALVSDRPLGRKLADRIAEGVREPPRRRPDLHSARVSVGGQPHDGRAVLGPGLGRERPNFHEFLAGFGHMSCLRAKTTLDEFLAGFGHMSCLRAKTTLEPEVLSRRTFLEKDKAVPFREAQDEVRGR
ncbi:hypothetical protein [Streptomyces sp. L7]|uniref:hypothetical protein n=1 Tax=Streptomyces sp. L7 TaxID=3423954 RepID=UPI003D973DAC